MTWFCLGFTTAVVAVDKLASRWVKIVFGGDAVRFCPFRDSTVDFFAPAAGSRMATILKSPYVHPFQRTGHRDNQYYMQKPLWLYCGTRPTRTAISPEVSQGR